MHRIHKFKYLVVFIAIVSIAVVCCNNIRKQKQETVQPATYLNLNDTVKYVGIATCKQCHEDIYNTFIETGMGKSFAPATKEKSKGKFDAHSVIYDKNLDYYYYPFWKGDSLSIMEFRLQGKDTIHKRIETVTYIVGSGQHTNSHIMNRNGYLYQMPMTFYTQKGTWDLPPGFENGFNTRFSRQIGLECMSCHNSLPGFIEGSENKFSQLPSGISCERCHGPGELHVKEKTAGQVVDISKTIDYSIVNPAKLPINLQFDACQRCHLQGNAVLNDGKSFFDFKPAMKLSEVMNVFMPVFKGHEEDFIMASHAERLKMSKCFINTTAKVDNDQNKATNALYPYKNALTCVTCHNPHVSVKVTGNEVFNKACINCHNAAHSNVCSEKEEVRKANSDNCVHCHMPKSGTIDIPHVTSTDHYIRKPMARKEINAIKEWMGIKCINNPSPPTLTVAKAYLNYYEKFTKTEAALDSAKKYLPDGTDEEIRQNSSLLIRYHFIKHDFDKIIALVNRYDANAKQVPDALLNSLTKKTFENDDAWTSYRVAEAFRTLGDNKKALLYFENAQTLAPFNLDFKNKLGAVLVSLQDIVKAKHIFEEILRQDPEYVAALSNLGYIYLAAENNKDKARELYDKALALDPDNEQALLNKAGWFAYDHQLSKAKELIKHLLKKHPENKEAQEALKRL